MLHTVVIDEVHLLGVFRDQNNISGKEKNSSKLTKMGASDQQTSFSEKQPNPKQSVQSEPPKSKTLSSTTDNQQSSDINNSATLLEMLLTKLNFMKKIKQQMKEKEK